VKTRDIDQNQNKTVFS